MSQNGTPDVDPALIEAIDSLRELHIVVTLDGEDQPPFSPRLSGADASALRVQSHGAWREPTLRAAIFEEDAAGNVGALIGPEEVEAIVFLAHRQAGIAMSYDAARAKVDAAKVCIFRFDGVPEEEAIDDPPPFGGHSDT